MSNWYDQRKNQQARDAQREKNEYAQKQQEQQRIQQIATQRDQEIHRLGPQLLEPMISKLQLRQIMKLVSSKEGYELSESYSASGNSYAVDEPVCVTFAHFTIVASKGGSETKKFRYPTNGQEGISVSKWYSSISVSISSNSDGSFTLTFNKDKGHPSWMETVDDSNYQEIVERIKDSIVA
jgi:hypothetical protein